MKARLSRGEPLVGWFFPTGGEDFEVPGSFSWSAERGGRLDLIGPVSGWPQDLGGDPFCVHGYSREGDQITLLDARVTAMRFVDEPTRVHCATLAIGDFVTPDERWPRAIYSTANLGEWRADTGLSFSWPNKRARPNHVRIDWQPPTRDEVKLPGASLAFAGGQEIEAGYMPTWSIATTQRMVVNVRRPVTIDEAHRRYAEPLAGLTSYVADRPAGVTFEVLLDPDARRRVEVWRAGQEFVPRDWRPGDDAFLFPVEALRNFPKAIRRWWRLYDDLWPALGLLADHVREGSSYSPARFLTLYTAVEAYCRERCGRKDLKLLRAYAGVPDEVTGCTPKALALIGVTRDYLAHLGDTGPFTVDQVVDGVVISTRRLGALMQACLMRELGFTRTYTAERMRAFHYRWPIT